ncbi:protein PacB, partial [Vibrio parahaemolyticus]
QSDNALAKAMALLGEEEASPADQAIAAIESGGVVECEADDYPDVRAAIQAACSDWIDDGLNEYAQVGLMEVERLDEFFKFYRRA